MKHGVGSRVLAWAGILVLGVALSSGVAEARHRHLTVDVVPDFDNTFETEPNERAFYIEGAIYRKGDRDHRIGTFRCWGWLIGGGPNAVVSQEYAIDHRGEIQVQGLEDERRAVVGGTGDFRFARGEGVLTPNQPNDGFRIKFHLR